MNEFIDRFVFLVQEERASSVACDLLQDFHAVLMWVCKNKLASTLYTCIYMISVKKS